MASIPAARVTGFLDSLGVNTHLNYTDGAYINYASVISDLAYLGIHQLRDATPDPANTGSYQHHVTALNAVAAAGNAFDFITSAGKPLGVSLAQISAIAAAHPGSIVGIEGPNEINNEPVTYQGLKGSAAAIAYQRDLFAAVNANPNLSAVPVYYYTGLDVAPTISGLADYANTHPYAYNGAQPSARVDSDFINLFKMTPPYPKVITETGYFNVPTANDGVDDATQAKNTLNLILDAYNQGVSITYIYQLLSAYPNNSADTQYGLFRIDHSPKPVATAIHNLTTILSDTGGTPFQPGQLDYAVCGLPASGNTFLMQKSTGAFELAVWAEPQNWNNATHTPINVMPSDVTVSLGATYETVNVYDPTQSASPIQTFSDVSSLQLDVTDHPLIIEINPTTIAGCEQEFPSPTFITGPTMGSGGHELALYLSADGIQGKAGAQITIDGDPLFPSDGTVTASHSAGEQEIVTVRGDWATPPTVEVSFTNDACIDFAPADWKLYVDGATYDGAAVPGAKYNFYGSGTYSFDAGPVVGPSVDLYGASA
jgi:hypothetical protein